jgi:hypothetical protein
LGAMNVVAGVASSVIPWVEPENRSR